MKDGYVASQVYRQVTVARKVHYMVGYPPSSTACGLSWEYTDTIDKEEITCKKCMRHIMGR